MSNQYKKMDNHLVNDKKKNEYSYINNFIGFF